MHLSAGLRFALLEIKIALVAVISRFKLTRSDKTEVPIVLKRSAQFHTPANGVWLFVEEV